jgi:hypothetical protein
VQVNEESLKDNVGLWLRLLGFALIPLAVQAFWPTVGGTLGMMTPLPLAYGMARRGYLEGIAAVSFIGLVTVVILSAGQGLYFTLETLPLCVGIRWTTRFKGPMFKPVLATAVLVGVTVLASAAMYGAFTDTAPGELYRQTIQSMGLMLQDLSGTAENMVPEQKQMLELWPKLFLGVWLATLLLMVTFYSLLVRGWMIPAGAMKGDDSVLLSEWRLPFPFVAAFIALASLLIFATGIARDVALNALLPLGALYGIQGVVIAGHMFSRWAIPSLFRVITLFFGIVVFPLGFALVGLFDTWIDFRQRWPLEMPPPPVT